jgi:hypothetical protein
MTRHPTTPGSAGCEPVVLGRHAERLVFTVAFRNRFFAGALKTANRVSALPDHEYALDTQGSAGIA